MTGLTTARQQAEPINPDQAARITASWPVLLTSPIETDDQLNQIVEGLGKVKAKSHPTWIMARVAALLSQYYAADVPAAAVSMMAEDWLEELREYPQWAITNAVRWWKSEANKDRKRRPLEGDISARCKHEMMAISAAEYAVRRYWDGYRPREQPVEREPEMTDDERQAAKKRIADLVHQAGFATQRHTQGETE